MSENKKPVRTEQESSKLSQLDMLLGLVCAIFFVDTIASVATMGAAAVTWIVIVGALFFFPGSLTVAELVPPILKMEGFMHGLSVLSEIYGERGLVGFTGPATLFGYHRLQHLSLQFFVKFFIWKYPIL